MNATESANLPQCPHHGTAYLMKHCASCRTANQLARQVRQNEKRRRDRIARQANPNRPPPTAHDYFDHPERTTAEDVATLLRLIAKEFGR